MKNSAVKLMIEQQFPEAEGVNVEFIASMGQEEEYKIILSDEGYLREFTLVINLQELTK